MRRRTGPLARRSLRRRVFPGGVGQRAVGEAAQETAGARAGRGGLALPDQRLDEQDLPLLLQRAPGPAPGVRAQLHQRPGGVPRRQRPARRPAASRSRRSASPRRRRVAGCLSALPARRAARPEPRRGPSAAPPLVPRAAPARPLPRPRAALPSTACGCPTDAAGTGGDQRRIRYPLPAPSNDPAGGQPSEWLTRWNTRAAIAGGGVGPLARPPAAARSPPAAAASPDGSSLHLSLNVGGHGGEELLARQP